jgi:hypothetical protein
MGKSSFDGKQTINYLPICYRLQYQTGHSMVENKQDKQ